MGRQKPDKRKQALANIEVPPEHRVEPRDPHIYLSTSPWQIMSYDYELTLKRELLVDTFKNLDIPEIAPVVTDNKDYLYRNKMEYALYWDNEEQRVKLAFHQRNSHRKTPFAQSSIERPEILAKAHEIIEQLNATKAQARDYQSLVVRCDQQGTTSAGLLENGKPHPQMAPLTDTLLDKEYTYTPNGFFQINLPVYEMALVEIKEHITTDKVLDLYAGVGTIGLSVASDHQLTLIETNQSAYNELVKNCEGTTAKPILAKSEEAIDFITYNTTVIVDPPRAGLDPRLIDALNNIQPPTIIYLSCNPITQTRDLALLTDNYQITRIRAYNFFPRTPHIENLVVLTKR